MWGTAGLSSVNVLYGASLLGAVIVLSMAIASGEFINPIRPWIASELAHVTSSLIHVAANTAFVWMVRAMGPVFAVEVAYLEHFRA